MLVTKWFKSTKEMIMYIVIFILLIIGFIYFGTRDYSVEKVPDNTKFNQEHSLVSEDNVFKYVNANEAYNYIRQKNVLMLFGKKNNSWVAHYANILNDVAKSLNIEKIYYYDIEEDRKDKNATYQAIVEYLANHVTYLDDGTANLYTPVFVVKIDGVISYYDDETSLIKGNITPEGYWNNYQTNLKETNLNAVLTDYQKQVNNEE